MVEKHIQRPAQQDPLEKLKDVELIDSKKAQLQRLVSGLTEKLHDSSGSPLPAHKFFAGLLTSHRDFKSLMGNLGESEVQERLSALAIEPEKLASSLKESIGGSIGPIPKHPIRARRLAEFLTSDVGRKLYRDLASTEAGSKAAAELFSDPAGPIVMIGVIGRGDDRLIADMISAKMRGQEKKPKQSVAKLWDKKVEWDVGRLDQGPGEVELRTTLQGSDMNEKYGLVVDFFSSEEKFRLFKTFISNDRNRVAVSAALKDEPGWTAKAFIDIVKTDEGRGRLARAMVDKNGNQVICSLAENPASEQCIFTLLNCGNPKEPKDKPGVDVMAKLLAQEGAASAVKNIIWAVAKNRRFGLRKGLDDIPSEYVERVA